MAEMRKLKKGERGNIISHRIGGDEVDKALNLQHTHTRVPVQDIVRMAIIEYNKNNPVKKRKY